MMLEKFVSKRCVPSVIWSDEGTTFNASEKKMFNDILNRSQQISTQKLVELSIR